MTMPNIHQYYMYCNGEAALNKRAFDNDTANAQSVERRQMAENPFANRPEMAALRAQQQGLSNQPLLPQPQLQQQPVLIRMLALPLQNQFAENLLRGLQERLQQFNAARAQDAAQQQGLLSRFMVRSEAVLSTLVNLVYGNRSKDRDQALMREEKEINDEVEFLGNNPFDTLEIKEPSASTGAGGS